MQFTAKESKDPDALLYQTLAPVLQGMGMSLLELDVFRSKSRAGRPGSVQIRAVVYREGVTGIDDCSRVHRGILPRLELAFPGQDVYLEVSSPGIDRLIRDGSEFVHYIGRGVKCYRTDISDWTAGILLSLDDKKIVLQCGDAETVLPYEIIGKARLDAAAQNPPGAENKPL